MAVVRHRSSWVDHDQLGTGRPYRPTYNDAHTLGPTHSRLLEAPLKQGSVVIDIGIHGSLRREDAAKLYELAYFGHGDILEFGCARGLSTSILAQGLHDAGRAGGIVSVDLDPRMIERTRANLRALNLLERVDLMQGDAAALGRELSSQDRKFGLVFVDHSHGYGDVLAVCRLLPSLVSDGGFVLFHDFNDRRNKDQGNSDYGVYWGVVDGLPGREFAFYGVFGCTALYRAETATEESADGRL